MPLYRGSRRLVLVRRVPAAVVVATTTWDSANKSAALSLSPDKLTATQSGAATAGILAIASHSSGTYYCEIVYTTVASSSNNAVGIGNASSFLAYPGNDANSIGWTGGGTVLLNNGGVGSGAASWAQGNTLCIAADLGNKLLWFRVNGGNWNNAAIGSQNPAVGSQVGGLSFASITGPFLPMANGAADLDAFTANFGATAYSQTPPSGYSNW